MFRNRVFYGYPQLESVHDVISKGFLNVALQSLPAYTKAPSLLLSEGGIHFESMA